MSVVPPMVAIITPTKNRLELLCETMNSVQAQTFEAWEHIVVDDGSDDGTVEEVLRRNAADQRVRYLPRTGQRSGANVCRNQGISAASADLIVFLDSDDLLRPGCLERRVEIMQRNLDLDFAVFPSGVFIEKVGDLTRLYHPQTPGDDLLRFLALEVVWEISGPIWRRRFLEDIGAFDESLLSMQDVEMHVRSLAARGKYTFFAEVDHDVRWNEDVSRTSVRHFNDRRYIEARAMTHEKLFDTVRNSGLLTWTRRRAITGLCFGAAESLARTGGLQPAVHYWMSASRRYQASLPLQLLGVLMLLAAKCGRDPACWNQRFINKWKGWMRFRQEPALMPSELQPTTKAH